MNTLKNQIRSFLYLFVIFYVSIYVKCTQLTKQSEPEMTQSFNPKQLKSKRKFSLKKIDDNNNSYLTWQKLVIDASKLYLNKKYLRLVKLACECSDSKLGVDRPTKRSLEEVLVHLNAADEKSINDALNFMKYISKVILKRSINSIK